MKTPAIQFITCTCIEYVCQTYVSPIKLGAADVDETCIQDVFVNEKEQEIESMETIVLSLAQKFITFCTVCYKNAVCHEKPNLSNYICVYDYYHTDITLHMTIMI